MGFAKTSIDSAMAWARRTDPALALVVGVFAAIQLSYLDYSPIWDTVAYEECLHDAVARLDLAGLNCSRHPSMAYLLFPALAQLACFGSFAATHLVNVGLGAAALVAFHDLLQALLPEPARRPERLVGTAMLALLPVVNANLLNWSPDFGVYAFFLLFLAALVRGSRLAAVAFGVALTFSKESGALMYVVTVAAWVAATVVGRVPVREWWPRGRAQAVWLLPSLLFAVFLGVRSAGAPAGGVFWGGATPGELVKMLFVVTFDRHLLAYVVGVFVLNFGWLLALVVAAAAVPGLAAARREWRAHSFGDGARLRAFFVLLLVVGFYVLTRFQTFAHMRYVLLLYPLYLLVAVICLSALVRPARARLSFLGVVVALLGASNFRTLDPVSRRIYGTFAFGDHELLRVTSITGECCGYGLDGLTYDLEFAELHYLTDAVTRDLKPTLRDEFALAEPARAWVVWRLDDKTFARTLRREGSFAPNHLGVEITEELPANRERIIFLEVPTADPAPARALLAARYRSLGRKTYERSGYRMSVEIFDGTSRPGG